MICLELFGLFTPAQCKPLTHQHTTHPAEEAIATATHPLIIDLARGVTNKPSVSLYTPVHGWRGLASDTYQNSTTPVVCFSALSFYWDTARRSPWPSLVFRALPDC